MKNSLNRPVPNAFKPFVSSCSYQEETTFVASEVLAKNAPRFLDSISQAFDEIGIVDGMCLSFHHHLRNGDYVMNMVLDEIKKRKLKNMILAPSAIFPNNDRLVELIRDQSVVQIYTNYLTGAVADAIANKELKELLIMDTHGGRARAIMAKEIEIDVVFSATPAVDRFGNGSGVDGPSACGAMGYIIPDVKYGKKVVLVSDYFVESLENIDIESKYVDVVVRVDHIGDASKIVSGTTQVTKDPVGLKIARDTATLLKELQLLKSGFSMQTGAGGTSLAVAAEVKKVMIQEGIKAKFASGGITGYFVEMLEEGLIEELYDVQCFDLAAVKSRKVNQKHFAMSSSKYANPYDPEVIVNHLDFVILGATEIDLDFNVNVTTSSLGKIMGGSGGHADAAHGAKVTIITTNLIKGRLPIIKEKVTTITTPGEDIDILVTERGIAINPKRIDLLELVSKSKLDIVPIEKLLERAYALTGVPKQLKSTGQIVGVVRYRDGTILDSLYECK